MSATDKRPYAQMLTIARGIVERLQPACHRIEIAGSLRRKRPLVGDIEIVAVPILHTNLFGEPLDTSEVDQLLSHLPITLHKNGAKYKQLSFFGSLGNVYTVDLFLQPDPATWAVNFLLRTGSADFSHKMVTPKSQGGYKPDGYLVRDARVWHNGAAIDTPEERAIFTLWGMDYIEPEDRV
ncbi:MAG: hypothetical protein IT328_05940 [Caldilineaceae bacterium]|nr:hypothetical protein [Caldilineaceae bacterium]